MRYRIGVGVGITIVLYASKPSDKAHVANDVAAGRQGEWLVKKV